jgi:hypothetical protein
MDKNNKLNIEETLVKAENIYNNTIHTSTKMEPKKIY